MTALLQKVSQDEVDDESKKEYEPIMDFKKDNLFKSLLKNPKDIRTYRILKGLCNEILHLEVNRIVPLNPELSPKSYKDKSMFMDSLFIVDDKSILNIEMQDSPYSKDHMYRLQIYGHEVISIHNQKGNPNYKDSIENFFQIIFMNAYDDDFPALISDFKLRDSNGKDMNTVVQQKGIENLNVSESVTFLLENGERDDIIDVDNEVMKDMYELRNEFNMKAISKAVEHNLERKKLAYQNIFREEGREEGLAEGIYNTQKEMTIYAFKVKHPDFDFTLLENLTLEQYKAILNLLINDKSLEEIQEILN